MAALTARERQVLDLLRQDKRYADMAAELGVSPHTVAAHMRSIRLKTNWPSWYLKVGDRHDKRIDGGTA